MYEEQLYRKHQITVEPDDLPESPRKWDNLGTMVCWHRRYNLGDEPHHTGDADEWRRDLALSLDPDIEHRLDWWENEGWIRLRNRGLSFDETCVAARRRRDELIDRVLDRHTVRLDLGLLDHSGLHLYVGGTGHSSDYGGWDSGWIGVIYATRQKLLREFGGKRLTRNLRRKVETILKSEVEVYDQFLTNDIWGYKVEHEATGWEDSCWGFYGHDVCLEAAEEVADWHCRQLDQDG